jgi:hypothetical protein
MEYHAGIDVSLERSSVCGVDASGRTMASRPRSPKPHTGPSAVGARGRTSHDGPAVVSPG